MMMMKKKYRVCVAVVDKNKIGLYNSISDIRKREGVNFHLKIETHYPSTSPAHYSSKNKTHQLINNALVVVITNHYVS